MNVDMLCETFFASASVCSDTVRLRVAFKSAGFLKRFLELAMQLTDYIILKFSASGLRAQAMDAPRNVSLLSIELHASDREIFTQFCYDAGPRETDLYVNLTSMLSALLLPAGSDSCVTITYDSGARPDVLRVICQDRTSVSDVSLHLMKAPDNALFLDTSTSYYTQDAIVDARDLGDHILNLSKITPQVCVYVDPDSSLLVLRATNDSVSYEFNEGCRDIEEASVSLTLQTQSITITDAPNEDPSASEDTIETLDIIDKQGGTRRVSYDSLHLVTITRAAAIIAEKVTSCAIPATVTLKIPPRENPLCAEYSLGVSSRLQYFMAPFITE